MEIKDIIEKLIGNIAPVGETNEDNERYENIDNLEEVLNYVVEQLLDGYQYIGSRKASELKIANRCAGILIELAEKLSDEIVS